MTLAYLPSPIVRANSQLKGLFLSLPICVGDLVKNVDSNVFIEIHTTVWSTDNTNKKHLALSAVTQFIRKLLWNQQGRLEQCRHFSSGTVCQVVVLICATVVVIICATVYILVFKSRCYHGQCNFSQGTGRQLHLFPNVLWQRNQKARSEFTIVTTQRLLHVAELISLP